MEMHKATFDNQIIIENLEVPGRSLGEHHRQQVINQFQFQ